MKYMLNCAYDNIPLIDKNDKFAYLSKMEVYNRKLKSFRLCVTIRSNINPIMQISRRFLKQGQTKNFLLKTRFYPSHKLTLIK